MMKHGSESVLHRQENIIKAEQIHRDLLQGETECHVRQMVRMPKGGNKTTYKVTRRLLESSTSSV